MAKRIPMTLLAAAASLAAILPLRGDPRNAPVTHPEWARKLLRALDVLDAVRATPRASHAFAALSWKTSLAFRGDDFATADHVEVADAGRVVATTTPAPPPFSGYRMCQRLPRSASASTSRSESAVTQRGHQLTM